MITVGIAAYNSADVLPELLDSLLAQRFPRNKVEIVVADNGSTDETSEILRCYGASAPIRLVNAAHRRGPAVARNAVVAGARGEVIAFTDSDCIAHPCWLAEIAAGFAAQSTGCVAGAILPGEPRTPTECFYARHNILSQDLALTHRFLPFAQTANASFRRDVFDRIGPFDEELITGEDADLQWRMQMETDYRICYRPTALVWHRHRATPRRLVRQAVGWGVGQALLYRKYRRLMLRDSWLSTLFGYRRILGLSSLVLRRWIAVRRGQATPDALDDAYLSLLFHAGIRLGRLRASLGARVFYP